MVNILGEFQKEVTCLQVVFTDSFHINMDASDQTESDKSIARAALANNYRAIFFVKPGGLDADEKPSDIQVTLEVSYPKPKAHRKAV